MSLVAWKHDPQDAEAGCRIVFAHTPEQAAEVASVEMCGAAGEVSTNDITRAPEFDSYLSAGVVPESALLAAGWSVLCHGLVCEHQVDADGCAECLATGRDANMVIAKGRAYCSEACRRWRPT